MTHWPRNHRKTFLGFIGGELWRMVSFSLWLRDLLRHSREPYPRLNIGQCGFHGIRVAHREIRVALWEILVALREIHWRMMMASVVSCDTFALRVHLRICHDDDIRAASRRARVFEISLFWKPGEKAQHFPYVFPVFEGRFSTHEFLTTLMCN